MSVTEAADRLAFILESVPQQLMGISAEDAAHRAGPGRWAPKEILGHLIDSASHNHQRFVRAQLAGSFACPGYEQESWVTAQSYLTESWTDLVKLWVLFNRHLLHLMRNVAEAALDNPVSMRGAEPVPLSSVMAGYVRHLEHHLAQILKPQPAA